MLEPVSLAQDESKTLIYSIKAGEPKKAQEQLNRLFQTLTGTIRICDPFFGIGTLVRLNLLQHCRPIRFLTRNLDNRNAATLAHEMKEWRQEHRGIEFRSIADNSIHDRYVLSDQALVILGHGLKDIGQKDSFVIKIERHFAEDLLDAMSTSFEDKWRAATLI